MASRTTGFPLFRTKSSGFAFEHKTVPNWSTPQETMLVLVLGFDKATAHAVQLVETSLGSWNSAPFLSQALPSNTTGKEPAGPAVKKILLVLSIMSSGLLEKFSNTCIV